jgi:hypothetical protein
MDVRDTRPTFYIDLFTNVTGDAMLCFSNRNQCIKDKYTGSRICIKDKYTGSRICIKDDIKN